MLSRTLVDANLAGAARTLLVITGYPSPPVPRSHLRASLRAVRLASSPFAHRFDYVRRSKLATLCIGNLAPAFQVACFRPCFASCAMSPGFVNLLARARRCQFYAQHLAPYRYGLARHAPPVGNGLMIPAARPSQDRHTAPARPCQVRGRGADPTAMQYVRRDDEGRFNEVDDMGRSLVQDRRRKAKKVVKAGQGDEGDQAPRKKRKKR